MGLYARLASSLNDHAEHLGKLSCCQRLCIPSLPEWQVGGVVAKPLVVDYMCCAVCV